MHLDRLIVEALKAGASHRVIGSLVGRSWRASSISPDVSRMRRARPSGDYPPGLGTQRAQEAPPRYSWDDHDVLFENRMAWYDGLGLGPIVAAGVAIVSLALAILFVAP